MAMHIYRNYFFDDVASLDQYLLLLFYCSHKYLVNGYGIAIKSYGHRVQPMSIEEDIVAFLDANDQLKHQVPKTS
jgi:hypothetical protein